MEGEGLCCGSFPNFRIFFTATATEPAGFILFEGGVHEAHKMISFFLRGGNSEVASSLSGNLGGIFIIQLSFQEKVA